MCGIAGLWNSDGVEAPVQRSLCLLEALAHRGPDGQGIMARAVGGELRSMRSANELDQGIQWETVLLHRRLSIVDVAAGAQPMANEDGRVWIVFNGEVYNHLDLRRELENRGHRFRTRADTEVVIHGWEEWGPGVLERLNGIYALAILDARGEPELWLARDPVGAKPLFVGRQDGDWWFASELAAARQAGLVDDVLHEEALAEFLVYRFIPSPGTPFRHAWKVPPGHSCHITGGRDSPRFLGFNPKFAPSHVPRTLGEWEEALRGSIAAAVGRQLMSDVPVGSLLSGGVDSTVVTGFMCQRLPDRPRAFAIGFRGDRQGELTDARNSARSLGVPLTEVSVSEAEYLAAWPTQIADLAEPIANSSTLFVNLLCRSVRATHKVVLSGQGADEPLGGYPRHAAERLAGLNRWLSSVWPLIPEGFLSSDRIARLKRIARARSEGRRFAETLAVFGPAEACGMTRHHVDVEALIAPVERWLDRVDADDSLNRLLAVDRRLSLADDLLIVADHMSMASSVELRVPFLDLEFLALVERMPSRTKVSVWGGRKWLYRRAVRDLLPPATRKSLTGASARFGRKLGFTTPLDAWFKRWCQTEGEEYLLGRKSLLPEFLHAEAVHGLVRDVRERGKSRARQLMSLYVLETWLRHALGAAPRLVEARS